MAAKKRTRTRRTSPKPAGGEPPAGTAAAPLPAGTPASAKAEKAGPDRPQLPDGKRPHDAVTWGDLIGLELVDATADTGNAAPTDA